MLLLRKCWLLDLPSFAGLVAPERVLSEEPSSLRLMVSFVCDMNVCRDCGVSGETPEILLNVFSVSH